MTSTCHHGRQARHGSAPASGAGRRSSSSPWYSSPAVSSSPSSCASAVDYYCNVDEIGQRSGCEPGRRLRVQGTVDRGTVVTDGGVTTFTISFGGASLPVRYDGQPGGIFEECQPVVVHGELANGTFEGDRIEVKHSNEYEAENSERLDAAPTESTSCSQPA